MNTPPAPRVNVSALPAPTLISPPDQSTFTNYPRTIDFRWSNVPDAKSYAIEIDCMDCCVSGRWCSEVQQTGYIVANLTTTEYQFNFWGNQRGRWRVWAVDGRSQPGSKSGWSEFLFISAGAEPRNAPFNAPLRPSQSSGSAAVEVYSPGPGITAAKAIYAPSAQHSDAARRARIRGDVLLEVIVETDGTVRRATVMHSLEPGLDANAIEAIKAWRFEPATKTGRPVPIGYNVSMSFQLQ